MIKCNDGDGVKYSGCLPINTGTEDGEMFRQMKERSKLSKKEREKINTVAISVWCAENGCNYEAIQPFQLRVSKGGQRLDIYPQSKKYHNLTLNTRGQIKGRIVDFLTNYFFNSNQPAK